MGSFHLWREARSLIRTLVFNTRNMSLTFLQKQNPTLFSLNKKHRTENRNSVYKLLVYFGENLIVSQNLSNPIHAVI